MGGHLKRPWHTGGLVLRLGSCAHFPQAGLWGCGVFCSPLHMQIPPVSSAVSHPAHPRVQDCALAFALPSFFRSAPRRPLL